MFHVNLLDYYIHYSDYIMHSHIEYRSCTMNRERTREIKIHGIIERISIAETGMVMIQIETLHNGFMKYITNSIEVAEKLGRDYCLLYLKIKDSRNYMRLTASIGEIQRIVKNNKDFSVSSYYYQSNELEKFSVLGVAEKIFI